MAVDPATVRTRIKALLDTLDGVGQVHKYVPRALYEGDCPQFIIIRGPIVELEFAFNTGQRVARIWRLMLILGKGTAGIYGDLEAAIDPWDEKLEDLFAANLKLNELDSELISAILTAEDGQGAEPGEVEWPPGSGNKWIGAEWGLGVLTKRAVTTGL